MYEASVYLNSQAPDVKIPFIFSELIINNNT